MKGYEMELFNLDVSQYGINLTTYFGDVYVFWRSIYLVVGIVIVLRLAKIIRKSVKK
jgi:hypothetical protein